MSRPALSLAVVGVTHPNRRGPTRHFGIALCRPGDAVELRPEPKNPADERAIAVYTDRDIQIGYLTAERAPWIGAMIKNGRQIRAVFQEPTQWGAVIRIAFDGEHPQLPTQNERPRDADAAFWPDEEAPDDF